jgi:predicted GNAT family acetyltransferase
MSNVPEASFTIEHTAGDTKGYYTVELNGARAQMTYSKAGNSMIIIDSTEVPDAMRGMPLCPFAKAQFARHPEWQDVLL